MTSNTDTSEAVPQQQQQRKKERTPKKNACSFELYLKPEELTPQRCQRIVKYARKRLRGQDNNSVHAFDNSYSQVRVPVITHSQIELGKQLGKGAFSSVYSIKKIRQKSKKKEGDEQSNNDAQAQSLVVKFLRTKLYDNHGLFAASAADLVKEGNILATLGHTNVIRIHAVSSKYGVGAYLNGNHDSYFLVLERLERTLSDRIKEWQSRHKALYESDELEGRYDPESALVVTRKQPLTRSWKKMFTNSKSNDDEVLEVSDRTNVTQGESENGSDFDNNNEYDKATAAKKKLLSERLDTAQQLADAIAYLHSEKVLHRDLKPDNIGFDINGDLKVFDFDIARVCPVSENSGSVSTSSRQMGSNNTEDETFLMTQRVGSPRYMSPECARREPYNLKADVYSYAILTHQILTLQKPFEDISDEDHDDFVFHRGVRPLLPAGLPIHTRDLLQMAWSQNISNRPNMETIRQVMAMERAEILRLGTIGQSISAVPVTESRSYVWSCSFAAISDNSKRLKKVKSSKNKIAKPKSFTNRGSLKNSKSSKQKGLLKSIFRKNADKPVKKGVLKEQPNGRTTAEEEPAWVRR